VSVDYSNTGSLNPTKDKRSEKSPDWWGKLILSGDVLEAIRQGKPVRVSGWNRDGKYGEFISLKVSVEQPRQETNSNSQPQQQRDAIGGAYDWHTGDMRPRDPASIPTEHRTSSAAPFDDDIPF
jgi:hypothetical protein